MMPVEAFAEYAGDRHWILSHLLQLLGALLMLSAILLITNGFAAGALATLSRAGVVATMALVGALQAVDGIALKAMVDIWAAAPDRTRESLFAGALAVRQIEIGFASISSLALGLTLSLVGWAFFADRRFSRWLGVFAIVSGCFTFIAGVLIAYFGFSAAARTFTMIAGTLNLVWMVNVGAVLYFNK